MAINACFAVKPHQGLSRCREPTAFLRPVYRGELDVKSPRNFIRLWNRWSKWKNPVTMSSAIRSREPLLSNVLGNLFQSTIYAMGKYWMWNQTIIKSFLPQTFSVGALGNASWSTSAVPGWCGTSGCMECVRIWLLGFTLSYILCMNAFSSTEEH